ncbi:nucleoside-diphosphate-sugar epimerase [Novosphingobium kunmingense]|uniref:Nucleoside-diphosphate-sugar epimerase n=1 Tax=Novosphingobium kunmingense TaxID=1211806 RepID=A0A2N0HL34_9SPHN|nr:NAD(P)-dependent oxidoreductase [Novosphingobium kunmingense]PKB19588.1 nucleoside-diphosphate-sugar epimerase [Novosphingobium kunmingense]
MTLAVTGATGFVGQALLDRAGQAGVEVRALARRSQPARDHVEWVAGDLAATDRLRELVRGAEAVVHIAGVVNAADAAGFEAGNVSGTLNLLEAALAEGVPRFVHVSSLSAREPDLSAYGASKARGEKLVMASPLDWTVVRPPGIYGPRDTEYLEMFKLARLGLMPVPPEEGRSSLIHVDDLARLLLALVPGGEGVTHQVFEPDDGHKGGWTHYELARAIGWAMGRRPKVLHLSRGALEKVAKADRLLRRDKAKLTLDRVGYMTHPDWVVGEGARPPAALWRPQVPTRDGLKATARWYREKGWL